MTEAYYILIEDGGWAWMDGDISACMMIRPTSISVTSDFIYIGENTKYGGIRQIQYQLPSMTGMYLRPSTSAYSTSIDSHGHILSIINVWVVYLSFQFKQVQEC